MRIFEPVAIVGTSCILPGALSPHELWKHVLDRSDLLSEPPPGHWGVAPRSLLNRTADHVASITGGYVTGFESVFNAVEFGEDTRQLDPLFQWVLWGAREALRHAGHDSFRRAGLVLGNLGYPSRSMARLAEALFLGIELPDPRHRFHFGLPAQLAARVLKLGMGGISIDAACASSLYAVKLACDRLHDRRADLMVAGGINRADDLFLHAGFTALGALSPSGRSRPFHRDADGLVPAEGAAFLALKRLEDAIAERDPILGVIRGIGCSNDGRGASLLTPHRDGQVRAMRAAYQAACIDPSSVSYVECHATGTPVGDSTELRSMQEVFHRNDGMPIGSLKSNLGHLITASGAAGIIKLLEAMRAGILPPTRSCDDPSEALQASGFRVLSEPRIWESGALRIAAISAFGFGGNNAHLILEEWADSYESRSHIPSAIPDAAPPRKIAITGVGVIAGDGHSTADFIRSLCLGRISSKAAQTVSLPVDKLRLPPRDLRQALPQQLLVLQAAQEAMAEAGDLPGATTGVFTGMEVDPAITRYGVRWRLAELLENQGIEPEPEWLDSVRNRVAPALEGPAVILGNMPNMLANRLNNQFDFSGPGFAVGAGENSGPAALRLAIRALRCGEIDAAVTCAVDLSCDPIHQHAIGAARPGGDAAVALVLQPLDDALRSGRPIYALIEEEVEENASGEPYPPDRSLSAVFGESFAASKLLHIAGAAVAARHRLRFGAGAAAPWLPSRDGWSIKASGFVLSAPPDAHPPGLLLTEPPRLQTSLSSRRDGDVAFVFTGAAAAYHGAGLDLLSALPRLTCLLGERFSGLAEVAGWIYDGSQTPDLNPLQQLQCSSFLSQIHAELTLRILKLRPDAMIGLSSGETNSLFAAGVWQGIDSLLSEIAASGLYDREIAGDFGVARRHWKLRENEPVNWINVRVLADVESIRDAIAAEPRASLLIIHAPGDCLIGGDAEACRRVIRKLGSVPAHETGGLAVHCPEMAEFANTWHALHRRPVSVPQGIRIYSNAVRGAYLPDDDTVADALTAQACATVDFPATVLRAWEDGIRIFIEHGPRSLCSSWIAKILGDRPHLAVSLDRFGRSSLEQASNVVDQLAAAGLEVDSAAFFNGVDLASRGWKRPAPGSCIEVPAHQPGFGLADVPLPPQMMPRAPALSPVVERYGGEVENPGVRINGNGVSAVDGALAALASLIGAIGAAHREAVSAHVEVLRRTSVSRLAILPEPVTVAPGISSRTSPPGRQFSRGQLQIHASGRISSLFGPSFKKQDGFRRQVRMPEPPLLLPDRVTAISGEPGSMQTGSIWTETDVRQDSWFLHENHVPPGILIEAGQADLFLISWLGVDFLNRDNRVYRMLSCELTFTGGLPRVGDTLSYDIHIDEHASLGDVRLFFFHFDCRCNGEVRLRMRNGQAGFFSDSELANPAGVMWDPASEKAIGAALPFHLPVVPLRSYTRAQVCAFAEGRAFDCFGAGYEYSAAHTATPRIPSGKLQLIQEIAELDTLGGPWKRGYMRVVNRISPTDWFFNGHFKNDPCMPGTLMAEAGLQAMAFYLAALGFTLGRDGWRFEPIPNEMYRLRCRGQVVPTSRDLTYEIFVHQIIDGPEPAIYADILGTVDGVTKAVHGQRLGLRLVPDWPLSRAPSGQPTAGRGAAIVNGFEFGDAAMFASATGRPSEAFGEMYRRFDGPGRCVRLPGAPYLLMSRVIRVDGAPESMQAGIECEAECDVEPHGWFFEHNGVRLMPFAILMEVALQPCGWLASYAGCVSTCPEELYFRNLDGTATVHASVPPAAGVLTTRACLTSLSRSGGIILVAFDVETSFNDRRVFTMKTGFGFFPKSALETQTGLSTTGQEKQRLAEPSDFLVDLTSRPSRYYGGPARLAGGKLLMLDRITGYWPTGGDSGLGRLRAEKDVDPREWFFKAHFFQDPVMPGSLGVESMAQLLQFFMLEARLDEGLENPYFEPLAPGREVAWKYRGQVIPTAKLVTVEMEIREVIRRKTEVTAIADSWLWVDGIRIYQAKSIAIRLVSGSACEVDPKPKGTSFGAKGDVGELARQLAIKEHVARCSAADPSQVTVAQDLQSAVCDLDPLRRWTVSSETDTRGVKVYGEEAFLDFDAVRSFWKKDLQCSAPVAIERLLASLIRQFVSGVRLEDPAAVRTLRGRPVLFLANHQTLLESALFSVLAPAVTGSPIIALAKTEQRTSFLVQTMMRIFSAFPELPAEPILYFDQGDPASLFSLTRHLQAAISGRGRSALVHIEGARNLTCRRTVRTVSAAILDMAIAVDVPIVPVRFTGGLPVEPAPHKLDLPIGFGKQDYWIGRPIPPAQIRGLPLMERKSLVLGAINSLGVPNDIEIPYPADTAFAFAIESRKEATGIGSVEATLLECAGLAIGARIDELLRSP